MPIRVLITSVAFTAILWDKSATVIVSGTRTSFITGSVGATKLGSLSSRFLFFVFGERQPATPESFLPLTGRFLIDLSTHSSFFAFLSFSTLTPIFDAGRCKVPSLEGSSFFWFYSGGLFF